MTIKELLDVENQLSCPEGEEGVEMGKIMDETNITMTISSIIALGIENKNKILEIGHGNCCHYPEFLKRGENIKFYGLEISETMFEEAKKVNFRRKNKATFKLYNGTKIPFKADSFDKIITVNTLYFWENEIKMLQEIYRVLRSEGILVIAFSKKEFMNHLPFVMEKFKLYTNEDFINLVSKTDFELVKIIDYKEIVKNKIGGLVNREYSVAVLKK